MIIYPGQTITIECESKHWLVDFSREATDEYSKSTDNTRVMLFALSNLSRGDINAIKQANQSFNTHITVNEFRVWLSKWLSRKIRDYMTKNP